MDAAGSCSMTPHRVADTMDCRYSLLGSSADDYGRQRPLLLQVDEAPVGLFAILEVKREAPRRRGGLSCFSKLRLHGVLFGVAVIFFIMASYILTGDKKGLLLTPSPYHFGTLVSPGPLTFNLSSVKDQAHVKLVVKSIASKVEFDSSRQLPELKALVNSEPHVSGQTLIIMCDDSLMQKYSSLFSFSQITVKKRLKTKRFNLFKFAIISNIMFEIKIPADVRTQILIKR